MEVDNIFYNKSNNLEMIYLSKIKTFNYNFEKENLRYRYKYKLKDNVIEVAVFDENQTIIQEYVYDLSNSSINCYVGSCNDYKKVISIIENKFISLFE